jgi:hemolysin III
MKMSEEWRVSPRRTQSGGEELANSISHGIGLCAALVGAPILLLEAHRSSPGFFFGAVIFAVTMSILSGIDAYHCMAANARKTICPTLDHSAIFLLGPDLPPHARPASGLWVPPSRACLGLAIFGVILKRRRSIASSKTGNDAYHLTHWGWR